MKWYMLAGFALCLLLGFQNCNRNMDAHDTNSSPNSVEILNKIDVSQAEFLEIPASFELEKQLQAEMPSLAPRKESGYLIEEHRLEIDVKTGIAQVIDRSNTRVPQLQYCLAASDVSLLNEILISAKACQSVPPQGDILCAMYITLPYAKLHFADSTLELGAGSSSCDFGPDLCGEQKEILRDLLARFRANLSSSKCP